MTEQENVQVVRELYAAFADVPAALHALTEDVDWVTYGPADIPLYGARHGRAEVAQVFAAAEALEVEQFEPQEFIAQGDKVVAVFHERGKVKATGRPYEIHGVDIFTLRDGKIASLRGHWDSASLAAAYRV